jgi:hypothetical protein
MAEKIHAKDPALGIRLEGQRVPSFEFTEGPASGLWITVTNPDKDGARLVTLNKANARVTLESETEEKIVFRVEKRG